MATMLKVTMNKIVVRDNGESPGKGELYWSLLVDDQIIDELKVGDARPTSDGETIVISNSSTVTKADTASVVVLGNVSERDSFLKGGDDTASFRHTYTKANGWGVGSHTASLNDGKHLEVTVYYSISKT
jgi:hypothetical protein